MTEDEFQLGIRDLSKHQLIELVNHYRKLNNDCVYVFNLAKSKGISDDLLISVIDSLCKNLTSAATNYEPIVEVFNGRGL